MEEEELVEPGAKDGAAAGEDLGMASWDGFEGEA